VTVLLETIDQRPPDLRIERPQRSAIRIRAGRPELIERMLVVGSDSAKLPVAGATRPDWATELPGGIYRVADRPQSATIHSCDLLRRVAAHTATMQERPHFL